MSCKDYVVLKTEYDKACLVLKSIYPDTDKLIMHNTDMIISMVGIAFQSGYNYGLKEDIESIDFNNIDYDAIFDEKAMYNEAKYIDAELERKKIIELLPIKAVALYDSIVEYNTFLESYIPKIAHYYGFVLGIDTRNVPSTTNSVDNSLCNTYKEWLGSYLNCSLK